MFARKAETKAAASHRGSAEHLDEDLAFAIEVLNRVCMIAVDLGARRKLGDAGCLAAQLFITKLALEEADERQLAKLQKRLVRLMDDLGKVCMVCTSTRSLRKQSIGHFSFADSWVLKLF